MRSRSGIDFAHLANVEPLVPRAAVFPHPTCNLGREENTEQTLEQPVPLNHCLFQVKRLYDMFIKVDCLQLEVNPLALTPEGLIYTADAKVQWDPETSIA